MKQPLKLACEFHQTSNPHQGLFFSLFFVSYYAGIHTRVRVLLRACVIPAEISTVICDKVEKAQVLLGNVERKETPCLHRIVLMDAFDSALVEHAAACGVHVQALLEVEVRRTTLK